LPQHPPPRSGGQRGHRRAPRHLREALRQPRPPQGRRRDLPRDLGRELHLQGHQGPVPGAGQRLQRARPDPGPHADADHLPPQGVGPPASGREGRARLAHRQPARPRLMRRLLAAAAAAALSLAVVGPVALADTMPDSTHKLGFYQPVTYDRMTGNKQNLPATALDGAVVYSTDEVVTVKADFGGDGVT